MKEKNTKKGRFPLPYILLLVALGAASVGIFLTLRRQPDPPGSVIPDPPVSEEPESSRQPEEESLPEKPAPDADAGDWTEPSLPVLVNPTHPMAEGYMPQLQEVRGGYYLDERAAGALEQMLVDAEKDGISLWIVSAYRSVERQVNNYNNKIEEYVNMGLPREEAVIETSKYIAIPGTSEHCLGLAVDLNSLEESFAQDPAYDWLIANCAGYGFILRYPKDKTDITGIYYEPWHYRYVGVNHARVIMEKKICLEEYLDTLQAVPEDAPEETQAEQTGPVTG